jgi:very-short-patch-repair endonuclease
MNEPRTLTLVPSPACQKEYDRYRFEELDLRELAILRFSNEEVLNHATEVLDKIIQVKK